MASGITLARMPRLLPVLLTAALALAACGGDEGSSSPTQTLETLQAAAKDRDGEKLCGLFTQKGLENIVENSSGQSCEDQVREGRLSAEASLDPHTSFEIGAGEESGDEAQVEITFAGDPETVDFKKEGGAWKIDESFP